MQFRDKVLQKISELVQKVANGDYVYRGEPACFDLVSSGLYREHKGIQAEHFHIEVVQREIVGEAKEFSGQTEDEEILTQLQHFGYPTNLIDFTTDYLIALFFACDGQPGEDGRVILLNKGDYPLVRPKTPENRVIAQKSVFVRPPKGFVEPSESVHIPHELKAPILEYLHRGHGLTTSTIYNDLHGFIRHRRVHNSAYVEFFVGLTQVTEGEYEKAINTFSRAIELNPRFPEAHYNRGVAYVNKGDDECAIWDFDMAIELNPEYVIALNTRGGAYMNRGDYDGAVSDFDRAIAVRPRYASALSNRGAANFYKGNYASAIRDYDIALEEDPDLAHAYFNRGEVHLVLEQWDKAHSDLTRARSAGVDIASVFRNHYGNTSAFEQQFKVQLPASIVSLLTPQD